MPLESCTGGHTASKSARDPKIVGNNPRKQEEMAEITSFADASRVVYRRYRASKSARDPKIMGNNPRKRLEMLQITSFVDTSRVVYRVSQGIEIRQGPENRGQ